jgi:hypothetical protein
MLNIKRRALRAGALAAVAITAFPAAASAAKCDKVATSKVFTAVGDTNDYFLAPGGDFEGALTWTTTGAVAQRWTHPALAVAGSTGLVMGAGSTATSPELCADLDRPTLRFGAFATGGTGSLRVDAVESNGKTTVLGRVTGSPLKALTGAIGFGSLLGLNVDTKKPVQLRLTVESGTWIADAVYVDPYMK